MAIRQYIGARYVPKFDGVHNINKSYEPLTIVTDIGNTTSYTSKKMVPVGIELTNTEYWAITGTLSGALLELQNRMTVAENDIDALQKQEKINAILIGDSWGNATGSSAVHGWQYYLEDMFDFETVYANAYGGAGFSATGSGVTNKSFIDLLMEVEPNVANPNDINLIIVAGGVNDQTLTDVVVKGKAFIDYADAHFPNAKILVMTINQTIYGYMNRFNYVTDYAALSGYKKKTYFANVMKCVTLTNWENELHLTDNGYKQVASAICDVLNGGSGITVGSDTKNVGFTFDTNNINIAVLQTGRNMSYSIPNIDLSNVSITGGTRHNLVLTPNSPITSDPYPCNDNLNIPIQIRIIAGGNTSLITGILNINRNNITISWVPLSGGTTVYTQIYIPAQLVSIGDNW